MRTLHILIRYHGFTFRFYANNAPERSLRPGAQTPPFLGHLQIAGTQTNFIRREEHRGEMGCHPAKEKSAFVKQSRIANAPKKGGI